MSDAAQLQQANTDLAAELAEFRRKVSEDASARQEALNDERGIVASELNRLRLLEAEYIGFRSGVLDTLRALTGDSNG